MLRCFMFSSQFQAACLVKNATTGEELQNEECSCGDETVACDVGPIAHYGMEMTFCNKLDDQEADQLYILVGFLLLNGFSIL